MSFLSRFIIILLALGLGGCALVKPLPRPADLAERLRAFPSQGLPLKAGVTVYWDDRLIPFIEAQDDEDLAFVLGLVQAHLRLAQMEIFRRASQGRLAELFGSFFTDIDHSIRLIDLNRAGPETAAALPPATRRWLERFVAGINLYLERADKLPHEFEALGFRPEPWSVADVLALSRLYGVDVNWLNWFRLLPLRGRPDWPQVFARYLRAGRESLPSFEAKRAGLPELLAGLSRSGSNCAVVAPARSTGGGALLASDPHLGIFLPNMWLIAGYKSPSYHLVGMMLPGLPAAALGRNAHLAWGGTNMRAASSDLFDLSAVDPARLTVRKERIKVRWWPDREVSLRDSAWGPVITDSPLLKNYQGPPLALRWVGHRASDEISAMLAANRARSWDEFKAAWQSFAVSGQNVLYADAAGNIGQLMAVRLPRRSSAQPEDLILDPARPGVDYDRLLGPADLPSAFNPAAGFLASANNAPMSGGPPVGYAFSDNDRLRRMRALLGPPAKVDLDRLKGLQRDAASPAGVELSRLLLDLADKLGPEGSRPREEAALLEALRGFDGRLAADSRGALAFEVLACRLARAYYGRSLSPEAVEFLLDSASLLEWLRDDLAAAEPGLAGQVSSEALAQAAGDFSGFADWGQMHRLELNHFFSRLPLLGRRYRFGDYPASGGATTLMKTSHRLTTQRHATSYGSNARHVSDLSDPDANWFVLLGGQDGWLASPFLTDQVPLWLAGEYIQVPLRLEAVRERFRHRLELRPAAPSAGRSRDG